MVEAEGVSMGPKTVRGGGCMVLMVKYPRAGAVKRRLARSIGEGRALDIYRLCVEDMVDALDASGLFYWVALTPDGDPAALEGWLPDPVCCIQQDGDDLGERLRNVFHHCFEAGHREVVALGSDTPDLPPALMVEAAGSLTYHDAVLGPCPDGGYYAIGFRRECFVPEAFEGIRWSTRNVFRETLNVLAEKGVSTRVLGSWRDIDKVEDLMDFAYGKGPGGPWGGKTRRYVRSQISRSGSTPRPIV
jgi:rSAM/selenodomain-associated transferase 1